MFQGVIWVNQDVIKVRSTEFVKVIKEHFIYVLLVYIRAVCQAERKHLILVSPVARPEYRKLFSRGV